MEDEEIKPQTGEEHDSSNRDEETDSESSQDLSKFFGDDETSNEEREKAQTAFLETFNKMSGKKFKSVDALVKSMKEADKAFAKAGTVAKPKEGEKEETMKKEAAFRVPKVIETLYFEAKPEAREVWKDVERAAKELNKDPFELYESSKFFQSEAKALYEEKNANEEDKGKVKDPSFVPTKKGQATQKLNLSDADRALLRAHGLSEKDVKISS